MKSLTSTNGKIIIVDDDDFLKVVERKWTAYLSKDKTRYYVRQSNGKIHLHHFVLGGIDGSKVVKFKNGNPLDCRKENLQILIQGTSLTRGTTKKKILRTMEKVASKTTNPLKTIPPATGSVEHLPFHNQFMSSYVFPGLQENVNVNLVGVTPITLYEAKLVTKDKVYDFGKFNTPIEAAKEYNRNVKKLNLMLGANYPLNDEKQFKTIKEEN